jgi:lipopolysaccharide transport system ATP-binding protein
MEAVIKIQNLSKQYRIGAREGYRTFRETLVDAAKAPFVRLSGALSRGLGAKSSEQGAESHSSNSLPSSLSSKQSLLSDDLIWALKDVSFEVKQGEVVGIIGRNGAGKSTLLKILSKITEPTEGRIELRGRVGSLLEVGTGFHPELTGHENIYLYGAILGMDRWEVTRKFDEIVSFAELDKFIDTPVKKYSSGMYMRLAFAVAAHLEPEILLVDEVLAVGDAAFQKKCLGKMGDVSKAGRTILFVSHNMQAVQSLCERVIQLEAGQIAASGDPPTVVSRYLSFSAGMGSDMTWAEATAPGNNEIRLTGIRVTDDNGYSHSVFSSNRDILVELRFHANAPHSALCVGFDIHTSHGNVLARTYHTDLPPHEWPRVREGENRWRCRIPSGFLNGGLYSVAPKIGMHNMYWIVNLDPAVQFEVLLDHGVSPFWNVLDKTNRPGDIAPILKWDSRDPIL